MVHKAKKDELEGVRSLEEMIFPDCWSYGQLESHIESGNSIYVLYEKELLVGYLVTTNVTDEWEVLRIATHPDFKRRGIARTLLSALWGDMGAGDTVFLEVRESNIPARALYEKNGFVECGKRKKYYSDGEDALIMVKNP